MCIFLKIVYKSYDKYILRLAKIKYKNNWQTETYFLFSQAIKKAV